MNTTKLADLRCRLNLSVECAKRDIAYKRSAVYFHWERILNLIDSASTCSEVNRALCVYHGCLAKDDETLEKFGAASLAFFGDSGNSDLSQDFNDKSAARTKTWDDSQEALRMVG